MEKSGSEKLQSERKTCHVFFETCNSRPTPNKVEYSPENSKEIVANQLQDNLVENTEEPLEKQPEKQLDEQREIQSKEQREIQPDKQPEIQSAKQSMEQSMEHPEIAPKKQPTADPLDHPKKPRHARYSTPNNVSDHFSPSVRLLQVTKSPRGLCGFYLTRSKWDPYPWVSAVDAATAAERSGLKAGDCVLEVNSADVLGLRIKDVAELVKAKSDCVTLLVWRTGGELKCDAGSLCCGPMPLSLQRLSAVVQSVLSIIECPVCLDTVRPPAMQCQNGHILCVNCRIRAEKCPVCRDRYTPRRALIAEQIYAAITNAFSLCNDADKLRQQLFGPSGQPPKPAAAAQKPHVGLSPRSDPHGTQTRKQKASSAPSKRHKLLARLLGKAYSMDNLSDSSVMSNSNQALQPDISTPYPSPFPFPSSSPSPLAVKTTAKSMQSAPNQLQCNNENAAAVMTTASGSGSGRCVAPACMTALSGTSTEPPTSETIQATSTFKHFSLPTTDLSLDDARIAKQHLSTSSSNSRCSRSTSTVASLRGAGGTIEELVAR